GWRYARGIGCYNPNGNKLNLSQLNREIANSGWNISDGVFLWSPAPVRTSNSFCGGGDDRGIWLMDGETPNCLEYKYNYSTYPLTVTYKGSKSWSEACSENNGYYKSGVCYYDKKDVRTACNLLPNGAFVNNSCYYNNNDRVASVCKSYKSSFNVQGGDANGYPKTIPRVYGLPSGNYCYYQPKDWRQLCAVRNGFIPPGANRCYNPNVFKTAEDLLCTYTACPSTPPTSPSGGGGSGNGIGGQGSSTTGQQGVVGVTYTKPTP
ncbi:MAG: hypothetical protein D6769_03870, partial [Methanobacteriota archaeon]